MREVDPFDYWLDHSSAIEGLGGANRSPDPRYCFHTRYHEVAPGRANFIVRLIGARANFGELSVRVHAWKPQTNSNVSLVSAGRLTLRAEDGADLTLPIRFASQKGVLYALYGYLSEDSDLMAQNLQVVIDESEDTDNLSPEPPQSVLAVHAGVEEVRPANALVHYGRPAVDQPVSQSCTHQQLASLGLSAGTDGSRADRALAQWTETLCVNALSAYGASQVGLEGLVVGSVAAETIEHLARSASLERQAGGSPPSRSSSDFFDFLLMPAALEDVADAQGRWEALEDWLARLKIGGLATLGLRYVPDSDLISSSAAADTRLLSRNEIGQWTLRLIGSGYSVAPLAFAPLSDLITDSQGLAGFVMIVQRL